MQKYDIINIGDKMDSLIKYINIYGNYSFNEIKFNEVDNILFSLLIYLDYEGLFKNKITLEEISKLYFRKFNQNKINSFSSFHRRITKLLKEMSTKTRFKTIQIYNYKKIRENTQFGAMCFRFNKNEIYVSYEGTDKSLIGWKEDFEISYKFPVKAQEEAIKYINETIKKKDKIIYIGGHSKGGNLAMCASMYAKLDIKKRINVIYNNDGPGFNIEQFNSKEWNNIQNKLITLAPEDGIIAYLLNHQGNIKIVKSNTKSFMQHDPTSWQCFGLFFETGIRTETSVQLENKITKWVNNYDYAKREKFITTIFNLIETSYSKVKTTSKTSQISTFISIIRETKKLNKKEKEFIIDVIKTLFITKEEQKEKQNEKNKN